MTSKNRKTRRKTPGKVSMKTKKQRRAKARQRSIPRGNRPKKAPPTQPADTKTRGVADKITGGAAGIRISVDGIVGETMIGDLILVFPRTREVLRKHGLRLEVEQAGDIYMTLDAFAALQGVKTENLIHELKEASKEPPSPQQMPQLVTPPTT